MQRLLKTTAALALMAFATSSAFASIIATEDWSAAPSLQDWAITDDTGGAANGALSNPSGSLLVGNTTGTGFPPSDLVTTSGGAGAAFLGDWGSVGHSMQFDFFFDEAGHGLADTLSVYMSNGSSSFIYDINLSGQTASTWGTYTANFGSDTGWQQFSGAAAFASVASSVSEIGFRLTYLENVAGQQFGIDNVARNLAVPEPETYAALGFALISICITFRRKISDTLAQVGVIKA